MPIKINVSKLNTIQKKMNIEERKEFEILRKDHTIQKNSTISLKSSNLKLKDELASLKKLITSSSLKTNPIVKKLIDDKVKIKDNQISQLEKTLLLKDQEILKYNNQLKIKPLAQDDFNNFIATSVKSLQRDLTSDKNSDYDYLIRDVQIEALVSTENRNGKMSFIIPTSSQLNEIDGSKLQRLKYSLIVAPKVT
jgi:hypothetical protein